jgi:hypothetical protein
MTGAQAYWYIHPNKATFILRPEHVIVVVDQRLNVRIGAADDEREAVSSDNWLDSERRRVAEVCRREICIGIKYPEQMVWHAALLFLGDFIGDYGKSLIHLHFVGIYDFRRKTGVPLLDFPPGKLNMNNVVFNPRRHKEKVVILMGATGTGKSRLSIYLGQFSGGNHKLRQNASALGTSHSHQ